MSRVSCIDFLIINEQDCFSELILFYVSSRARAAKIIDRIARWNM